MSSSRAEVGDLVRDPRDGVLGVVAHAGESWFEVRYHGVADLVMYSQGSGEVELYRRLP